MGAGAILTGPMGRRPTMADVAQRVGVSRQLVGIAFRGDRGVSAETRERILRAADELGYHPDIAARALRRRASNYFGVVFAPAHSADVDIVDALYAVSPEAGFGVILSAVTSTRDVRAAVDEVLGHRCAALLVIGSVMPPRELRRLSTKLPVVLIGSLGAPHTGCDDVSSAGDRGIAQAVDHLWNLGHRDIAYLYGEGMPSASVRHQGYLDTVSSLGVPPRTVRIPDDYTEESGARAATILLQERVFPTAVVASNDHAAVGFIHACLRAGIRVPTDVSVTGFDDSGVARLSYVELTTVQQDGRLMAAAAVAAALSRIEGRRDAIQTLIPSALVVRSTTSAPRRKGRGLRHARSA